MAKKDLAEVLQTDVMTNLPIAALAQIVRSKGRGRDTILAHITPREAKKLKREGGRGSTNPDTGLPEFEDSLYFDPTPVSYQGFDFQAPSYTPEAITQPIQAAPQQDYSFLSTPQAGFQQPYQVNDYTGGFQPFTGGDYYAGSLPGQYAQVIDGRSLFVPRPTATDAKIENRVPTLTAPTDAATVRNIIRTPEGVDVAETPEGVRELEQRQMEQAQAEKDAEAERVRIANQAREQDPNAPARAPVAGASGSAAATAASTGSIAAAVTAAGIDVGKLSSSDMARLNQIQSLVANGTMTVEQAQSAITDLAKSQSFTGGLTKWVSDPGNALKLALGLGAGAFGMLNMANAKKQASDVANQMRALSSQYATMAQPMLQQGGQQYGLAAQGILTPAAQQQFDVGRAQLAQAAAKTGSVGSMQATQIAEQLRQQALNSQMTQGLQVLAAGNAQMGQALQTQLSALNTNVTLGNQAAQAAQNFFPALGLIFGGVKG
jgi:hypothetical protein